MRDGHSDIWTHLVLSSKMHEPIFSPKMIPEIQQALEDFISQTPNRQGTYCVLSDHIHLLVKLPPDISINTLANQIQDLVAGRLRQQGHLTNLEWDSDYHAHSVSLNRLEFEKSLIQRQPLKHQDISLAEELKFLGM
ncbi:transposase [Algoriphagus namhaensis]|uniref:Transposase n=1 Tax=Algoriphagus namhaensis TaxID=915353 RepID=A0ABV8AXH0_9BACT